MAGTGPAEGQDDEIRDWSSGEDLRFAQVSIYAVLPKSYSEFTAGSYAQAHAIADAHMSAAGVTYVAAQVGGDVIVFAETDGSPGDGADIAVVLAGRTLADVDLTNFV